MNLRAQVLCAGAAALLLAGCAGAENAQSGAQHTTTVYVSPTSSSSDPQGDPGTGEGQAEPGAGEAPAEPAAPAPPVAGAHAGAGGPRPAEAEPLPTYNRMGRSAALYSPNGGIGCEFYADGPDGYEGGCGVKSYRDSELYGCHQMGATCTPKTTFSFVNGQVQPISARSDVSGYMDANLHGYTVPKIEYGRVVYFDNWTCASEMHGMTCWNTETGSGVFLSNERSERF